MTLAKLLLRLFRGTTTFTCNPESGNKAAKEEKAAAKKEVTAMKKVAAKKEASAKKEAK